MSPSTRSHQRNKSTPVKRDPHTSTASSGTPAASLQKGRQHVRQISFQNPSSTPSAPSATDDAPFDPKSILPVSKSLKSFSKLLEASSSSSANKPMPSQKYSFSCIDGATRTFAFASNPTLLSPPSLADSPQIPTPAPPVDHPASSSEIDHASHREQFKAFGIEAYPTRARFNEICYDFTSNRRWCSHGSYCYRIHPLNKAVYLAEAIHDSVQISRSRWGRPAHPSISGSLFMNPNVQVPSSSRPSQPSDSSNYQPCVTLPRSIRSPTMSGIAPRPLQEPYSTHVVTDLDLWDPRNEMRDPPWANHSTSDTSSSSNVSEDGISMWDPHTDARDWEITADEDELLYGEPTPQLSSGQLSSAQNMAHYSAILHQNSPPVDDSPGTVRHPRPKNKQRCQRWLRDECQLGYDCSFVHDDLDYDIEGPPLIAEPSQPPPKPQEPEPEPTAGSVSVKRHPRPKRKDICRGWLRFQCDLGYQCRYVHNDLVYDDDEPDSSSAKPLPAPAQTYGRIAPEIFSYKLHDHIRIRVGPGFQVEELTTGFESQWVYVGNLPKDLTDKRLTGLLRRFGEVIKICRPPQPTNPLTIRVQFSKPLDAYRAFYTLHGSTEFGRKLDLRMAVETKDGGSLIEDTVVRIDWDAPHRNVYMGYPNESVAQEVVAKARRLPCDDFMTSATKHVGLPAVGQVTVKFTCVPVDVTEERMEEIYGPHQGMVTERPNYTDFTVDDTIKGVNRLLQPHRSKILDVEFRPPPYRDGKMRAWVHCASHKDAQAIAENLHNRKPRFMGHTRVGARHVKSIKYSIPVLKYHKVATELQAFAEKLWRSEAGYSLKIIDKILSVSLMLSGEDMKVLRRLKAEVEQILNGQLLLERGVVAWDDFLGRPAGFLFLQDLDDRHPGVTIERNPSRRTVRLFGSADVRGIVQEKILDKIHYMRTQKSYIIPLEGRLAHAVENADLKALQDRLGHENVTLDLWNRLLRIRGDKESFAIAQDVVAVARAKQQGSRSTKPPGEECPVCFDEPTSPIRIPCGHLWCEGCLRRYFAAAIDQKIFPITCLGNEGKCKEPIPLLTARGLMDPGEVDAIVNGAFSVYVQTHSNDYHYCPTPDCSQVYPTAPEGVTIQCPSCLVRICPHCHTDSHEGLTCAENKNGEELFQSWVDNHNVKQCPGCKISIEKDEGCNHMVCTVCKTHICWVCMKTFPNGQGIYVHMSSQHGSFGLGPIY